jgi:hypothetical protein
MQSEIADDDEDNERIQFQEAEVKKLTITALLVVVLTMVLAVPAMAAPTLHKVTGGGTVEFPGFGMESYGFTGRQVNEDGTATGHFHVTLHYPSYVTGVTPWIVNGDILYLAVNATAGEAWIGLNVTSSNDPFIIGTEYVVRVKDGGEGKDAGPDMIGFMDGTRAAMEALDMPTDGFLAVLFPWTNGNVQVK